MQIVLVGVDHTSAPIQLREQLACAPRQVAALLRAVRQVTQEAVLLSTCNRFELYAVCAEEGQRGREALLGVLCEQRSVERASLEQHSYTYTDLEAARHLFGVACGLYSLIPGEPQIQGQVADALELAQGGSFAGPVLSALFRAALVTGKRARRETGISRRAVSISHAAVQLARQLFPHLNEASVLLVGSGQMSELAARNLCDNGARRLIIVNRTAEHAQQLVEQLGERAFFRPFSELPEVLVEADVVITSTTAPHTVVTEEMMRAVLPRRQGRPLLIIDIALPRDVDPAVGALPGVHLYNIDDLRLVVDEGIRLRLQEVAQVERIIAEEVEAFARWLSSLSVTDTIVELREHVEALRQQELARTLRQLAPSLSERELAAIQELTTRLMNKVLHKPVTRLKEAAVAGRGHVYAEALRYLFDLEVATDEQTSDRDTRQQAGPGSDTDGDRQAAAAISRAGDHH
ncbi:glutamyl-tRNA reductase [Thermogemmatispora onikobensis]|uniref:glutamyl-tRNA reductase n=1 Tax=Thermogemmatispora onikobensis TaxID=732234 RepID=UPI00085356B8|nr:glutamyl-tRNA reductase [Thermogemmatispora onikobensis]